MLRTSKNTSIYTHFGHNRSIETIDGYDETVHCGHFENIAAVGLLMERPDEALDMRYKTP